MSYAVMPQTDWQNIVDSVRAKTGKSDLLVSGNVASEIDSISGDVTPPDDVPSYVKEEADAVASAVRNVQTGKTLTFVTMADTHVGMARTSQQGLDTIKSALMAGQGLAYLRNILPIHAGFVLGDLTWSDGAYAVQQVYDDWQGTVDRLSVGFGGLPSAWTAGNHEINYGVGRERSMTEGEINAYIGSNSKGFVRPDGKCYGYIDFPIQKIRVIVINTADTLGEYPESDTTVKAKSEFVGAEQLQWLANTALDFSDKSNASEWGIVICSHHPLSYGGDDKIGRAMAIVEAYKNGTSGSITYNSDKSHTVTYNFTSGNRAEIICNICGHSHNFGYGYMRYSSSIDPWLLRLCTPCINCGRENEHATNESLKSLGEFDANGNPVYWRKTANTRNGTSFCINTIDRENKMIYSHKFGAGVDRAIYYGEEAVVTYSVTNSLDNCTINNTLNSVIEGSAYSATLTANSGYTLDSITVIMGGADITSTAVSGSAINIASVTGDIVITAIAVEKLISPPTSDKWTNRVLEATSTFGGTEIYNTYGYMDGMYATSSGGQSVNSTGTTTATGYIAYNGTSYGKIPTIYIKGIDIDPDNNNRNRMYFYREDGSIVTINMFSSSYFEIKILDADTHYYCLSPIYRDDGTSGLVYNQGKVSAFVLSGTGKGENLIVTLDEPIEDTSVVGDDNG